MGIFATTTNFMQAMQVATLLSSVATVKDAPEQNLWEIGKYSGRNGNRYTNQRDQLRAYQDWVFAVTTLIAREASTIDFKAYANRTTKPSGKVGKELMYSPNIQHKLMRQFIGEKRALEELDNHIILELLEKPNPVMDGQSFIEFTILHMLLAGEGFWAVMRDGSGKPNQLWPMYPYGMTHNLADDATIKNWTYRIGANETIFDVEDVIHFPFIRKPTNFYRGSSVIEAAATTIETERESAAWNKNFFKNGASPGTVAETDKGLGQDQVDRLAEQWNDKHQGVDNAHKLMVLEGGLKIHPYTSTQKDMDFLKGRQFNRDYILAMYHTSRALLGIVEGDGRSNMEVIEANQAKRVTRPLMQRLAGGIQHKLAGDYDAKLVIGFTDPVPEDKEFKLKEDTQSINTYRTINEVREERGLDPIEGGDVIYQQTSLQPLGTPQAEPAAPDDNQGDPPKDDAKKSLRSAGKKKASTAVTSSAKK